MKRTKKFQSKQPIVRLGVVALLATLFICLAEKAVAGSASNVNEVVKPVKVNVLVLENASKSFRWSPAIAICKGSSARLKATGMSLYSWAPSVGLSDSTGDFVYAYPLATATYTVTGVDARGMKVSATVTVKVNGLPFTNVSPDTAIVAGKSVVLFVTGGSAYCWAPAAGLSSARGSKVVAAPHKTTAYMVTAVNVFGCKNSTAVSAVVCPKSGSKKAAVVREIASSAAIRGSNDAQAGCTLALR